MRGSFEGSCRGGGGEERVGLRGWEGDERGGLRVHAAELGERRGQTELVEV